jgi:4-hydroxymandelate oxidase
MTPVAMSLAALEAQAGDRMDPAVRAYVDGGAADEITCRENRQAWQSLRLRPRVLRELSGGHTRIRLLGREWPTPLLVAPMACQGLLHPDAEAAVALAASAQGWGLVLSGQSSLPAHRVAGLVSRDADRGPLWLQLAPHPDDALLRALADEAQEAGFEALVLTVDAPVQGVRDRQRAAGFHLPAGAIAEPRQRMRTPGRADGLCGGRATQALTWPRLERLVRETRLPVLLKGITHPDDARQASDIGCAGVIVSNHGGRTLDTVPATAVLLPEIAEALDGRPMALLVDGGLRRGTDVVKALALGAHAVLVGRPVLHGLAVDGAAGVARVLRHLRDELEVAMVLCGCAQPAQVGPALLHRHGLLRARAGPEEP